MSNFDYKKEYKDIYLPSTTPMIIQVPPINYVSAHGFGNPNEEDGAYKQALQLLYGISYTIKMSKKTSTPIDGYFDYVVPPLEGLWWMKQGGAPTFMEFDKCEFEWISMIRLPEFVDQEAFDWACASFQKKHPEVCMKEVFYSSFKEGLCAQVLHKGSYDSEATTIKNLHDFIEKQGYICDYDSMSTTGQLRKHHEIYLSDPRRTKLENLKTVIRLPIKNK